MSAVRIGVIGSGKIGATAARPLIEAGHEVAIANSRGPESLRTTVEGLGERARAATVDQAANFGELVLVAIPLHAYRDLPARHFAGNVVIDANNYYPARDGNFDELDSGRLTSSELLAEHLAGANVIKAFNTMNYATLGSEGRPDADPDERLALFIAGDDPEAKATVAALIDELGFTAVDTGSLADGGRRQQPGTPIYNRPMTAAQARAELERP